MMRTSPSQFEVMMDFMERNGDLNRPAEGPHGRLRAVKMWRDLTNTLNLDTSGTAKPVEKWKKVWNDLKNNTKRKAAKIKQAAGGTGGGPASTLTLTDLEQRVFTMMGTQAATAACPDPDSAAAAADECHPHEGDVEVSRDTEGGAELPTPSIEEDWNRPGGSSQATSFTPEVEEARNSVPTQHHAQSPRRVIRGRRRRLLSTPAPPPTRRNRPAVDMFISSDELWRNLATEFVAENRRLREAELQQQAQWQTLFAKLIDIADKFLNK